MCSATRTHTQRNVVYVLPSLLYLPLSLPSSPLPPSLQNRNKNTALMKASVKGYTAAAEAIVAADPHPDHIRMTDVRSAGRGEGRGVLGGMGIGGEGGYVLRRGGGEGTGERRQCILSPLSTLLPAICSPIPHTVYMFTNPLCILSPVSPPLPSLRNGETQL